MTMIRNKKLSESQQQAVNAKRYGALGNKEFVSDLKKKGAKSIPEPLSSGEHITMLKKRYGNSAPTEDTRLNVKKEKKKVRFQKVSKKSTAENVKG